MDDLTSGKAEMAVDRDINLCLVEMTKNPFYEWVMRTIQLSFGSYDHVLYEDPHARREVGINWRCTADALMEGDIQKAMQWFGHWYVLLERCLLKRYGEEVFNSGGDQIAPPGSSSGDDPSARGGRDGAPPSGVGAVSV